MSYEPYKDFRLAPDDNGCWDVLDKEYQQKMTFPSKAAAKRWIDSEVDSATPPPTSEIDSKLEDALKRSYFTVITIAKDDPLQDAFDTWLDINGQRYGITFDKTALTTLITDREHQLLTELLGEKQRYVLDKNSPDRHGYLAIEAIPLEVLEAKLKQTETK